MSFLNLAKIRKSFKGPRLNHRWSVQLVWKSDPNSVRLVSDYFPATSVNYNRIDIESESIDVAPGLVIPLNNVNNRKSKVTIGFVETAKKDVLKFLLKYTELSGLNVGKNYFPGKNDALELIIKQYSNDTSEPDFTDCYIVEPTGDYVDSLGQSSEIFTGTINFNILGIQYEKSR